MKFGFFELKPWIEVFPLIVTNIKQFMKSNSYIRLGLCILCLQFFDLKHADAQRKIDNLYYNIDV